MIGFAKSYIPTECPIKICLYHYLAFKNQLGRIYYVQVKRNIHRELVDFHIIDLGYMLDNSVVHLDPKKDKLKQIGEQILLHLLPQVRSELEYSITKLGFICEVILSSLISNAIGRL